MRWWFSVLGSGEVKCIRKTQKKDDDDDDDVMMMVIRRGDDGFWLDWCLIVYALVEEWNE